MIIPTYGIYLISAICILLVIACMMIGYKRGFILKVLDFVSTFLCLPIALIISNIITKFKPDLFTIIDFEDKLFIGTMVNQTLNKIIIFILVFIVVRLLCFLLTPFCKFIDHIPVINVVNNVLGSIIGIVQGLLLCLVLSYILCTPAFLNGKEVRIKSGLEYLRTTVQSILWEPGFISTQEEMQELINSSKLKDIEFKKYIDKSEDYE